LTVYETTVLVICVLHM